MEAYSSMAKPSGYTEETLNLSMTAKQPPSYDGKVSWFRYEELVDDWVTITTVEAPKRGPLLKSRLTGDAYMYKAVLQNDLLQDPDEGVNYFKNYFLKGATNVYLYRLLSFFNHGRQNQEFLIFTSKFGILLMRLKAAWMDLMPYSYEMLKTHYHELFITTRTSIQDPSIRPQRNNKSNTFFIIEQGEYEGEEGCWVEDEEGLEGFMSNNDEETFWVLEENDAFIARKVSGRNFRFKKRKGKGKSGDKKGSHQRGGLKPFRKSGSGGKANMANENYDLYDQAFWGKGKGKGKKGNQNSNILMMAKEKAEKTEEQPAIQQTAPSTEPTYAGWTDQDWDQSWTWNEQGWYSSHETSRAGQAQMAFHDAYEHHEKEAIHGKLIQSDAVSEHNLSVTTNHSLLATKLMAPVTNPQHNPTYAILDNGCTRSMGSWHATQRFTQAIEFMKDIISYQCIPAGTKFTFANGETARVNWTLHL